ncbi:glycoside hydrolase family 32 protein [Terrisporobacter vanillatitrophus]|uniref:glycoside hydrolase family 32 protein n=1 Tax=Terrisporobacter vanillatitrophus TaxID=3058402 RepID=UPI0033666944
MNFEQMKKDTIEAHENGNLNSDKFRLSYHLMPPIGWLNDPNGLCELNGTYHIYYQYSPTDVYGELKHWGHYSTKDFINFKSEPMAIFADNELDKGGAYSGSTFIKDNKMHVFYTGNVKEEGDHDYIKSGRQHNTIYLTSEDGINFSEKKCLMKNVDYPSDVSCHVRDPKVYEKNGLYYMVLGARTLDDIGCILVYESKDLINWKYINRIQTKEKFGYMWECPDVFDLDNKTILITCPQGIEQEGIKYENIYQNGYLFMDNIVENTKLSEFNELDNGFDFYAPQTFEDEKNRRILIGWMGLPDIPYTNEVTVKENWQHALTIPRALCIRNNKLYQKPIEELKNLRKSKKIYDLNKVRSIITKNNVYELNINLKEKTNCFKMNLRSDLELLFENNIFTLKLGKSGYGRDERHVYIDFLENLQIYSDTSSLEIFINNGEKVMTTRVYDDNSKIEIKYNINGKLELYNLNSYSYK